MNLKNLFFFSKSHNFIFHPHFQNPNYSHVKSKNPYIYQLLLYPILLLHHPPMSITKTYHQFFPRKIIIYIRLTVTFLSSRKKLTVRFQIFKLRFRSFSLFLKDIEIYL
jgi:hypothetical protein